MKGTLLLTSQGIPKELEQDFLSYLKKPLDEVHVSFIVTAAYGEEENPIWLECYRKQIRSYGISHIDDLDHKGKSRQKLENDLADKDVIFVNGGNAFYLLYWVKKSGFDNIVKNLLGDGKIYVGVSAGSYIACPTIEQSTWKHQDRNKIGLDDLNALNLVPFLVTAHFEEKYRSVIEKASKTTKCPIVALNDEQAVLVRDNKMRIVGKGKKVFFNGFRES